MKTIEDLIQLWSTWFPDEHYVCPTQAARYYWFRNLITRKDKPLFENWDINDVAAVFAGTKPAAIVGLNLNNPLEKGFALLCEKYGINCRITKNNEDLIFARENILDEIENALQNKDGYSLGILLGYPQKSVEDFMKKYGTIKLGTTHKLDEEWLKNTPKPNFHPSSDWFE
jgi:hypothetical protein